MKYPKTIEELKEQGWQPSLMKMGSMREGVTYSAYVDRDRKLVANVDNSDGEVTIIFSVDPISVLWVHPKTVKGAEVLGMKWKIKK